MNIESDITLLVPRLNSPQAQQTCDCEIYDGREGITGSSVRASVVESREEEGASV